MHMCVDLSQSKMEDTNFEDIELFIGEIKKYPAIWNVSSEEYHDRTKKRGAWINVCQVFIEGFDVKDDKEKNEICNKYIKKWRNIKDNYNKSLKKKTKSGQAANSGRRYIYARQLAFLETARTTTDTQSSLGDHEEQVDIEHSEEQSSENLPQTERSAKPPRYEQDFSRKRKRDVESSLIDFMKTPIPCSTQALPETNPDKSFFDSIIPSISSFTEGQKLELRSEVLNIIKRIRMSSRYHPSILHPTSNSSHLPPTQSRQSFTQLTPIPSPFIYLPQAQSSTQPLTELRSRPSSTPIYQAHISPALSPTELPPRPCSSRASQEHIHQSPISSNCTSVDNQIFSEEDTLDLFCIT